MLTLLSKQLVVTLRTRRWWFWWWWQLSFFHHWALTLCQALCLALSILTLTLFHSHKPDVMFRKVKKNSRPGIQVYTARSQRAWDLASGPWLQSLSSERCLCTSSRVLVKESRHWKYSTSFHCANGHSYFTYFILQGSEVFRHFKLIMTCHSLSGLFIVSKHI